MKKPKPTDTVTFTPDTLREFAAVYDKQVQLGNTSFVFQDRVYDTRYAHYLIEYLKGKFNGG